MCRKLRRRLADHTALKGLCAGRSFASQLRYRSSLLPHQPPLPPAGPQRSSSTAPGRAAWPLPLRLDARSVPGPEPAADSRHPSASPSRPRNTPGSLPRDRQTSVSPIPSQATLPSSAGRASPLPAGFRLPAPSSRAGDTHAPCWRRPERSHLRSGSLQWPSCIVRWLPAISRAVGRRPRYTCEEVAARVRSPSPGRSAAWPRLGRPASAVLLPGLPQLRNCDS